VQTLENISVVSAVTFILYFISRGIKIKDGKNVIFKAKTMYINVFVA
jgi:hypothetical protein